MRLNAIDRTMILFLLGSLTLATCALADVESDYAKALEKSLKLAKAIQSYEISANLVMENNVKGQTDGMTLEATQVARGQMPDRLSLSIESPMFQQQLGCGPEMSWFSMPAAGVCYVGKPLELTRTFEDDGNMELTYDKIFNFYSGLGDFVLTEEMKPLGETVRETLTVGGTEVSCQVFGFENEDGTSQFWFDPQSGLVLKTRIVSHTLDQGMEVERILTTEVSNFALDTKIPDDKFLFEVPSGVRVVDTLERIMNPDSMVGMPAPEISFTDLDGNTIDLKDYRGKVVFIDFWATWCGPCRMEMPHIEKLFQELKGNTDLAFFGASNEDQKTVEGFLKKNKYSFPIVLVNAEDARTKFKVTSIPAGFVIDREGIIRAHMIGTQNEAQLRAAFAKGGFGE
jgi:thiol-disulfide isomerase/thioredoxin